MYDRLKAYKNHNGDCNIPYSRYPEDQTLAKWVFTQWKMKNLVIKKNGKYWKRVEKLNAIGFIWSIR